jgi:hypothetical protein
LSILLDDLNIINEFDAIFGAKRGGLAGQSTDDGILFYSANKLLKNTQILNILSNFTE